MDKEIEYLDNESPQATGGLPMKYSPEERLEIGRRIYTGELTKYAASEKYGISINCARDYMRLYRDTNHLPPKQPAHCFTSSAIHSVSTPTGMEEYESMTKEELIRELVKARITEARLKKGYEVKGDGTVVLYDNKNIR